MRVLKILFASVFALFLTLSAVAKTSSHNPFASITRTSLSNPYSAVTKDPQIIQALDLMNGTSAEWAKKAILGDNASGKPMIIEFKNLSEISPDYTNFDALGWKKDKQLYIYLNEKHRGAPPEALASTLSHESVHQDQYCSLEEETYAWGYEADVWLQMVKKHPQAAQIECPLTDRLNTIARMFKNSNYSTTNQIRSAVYSNPGYKGLPIHSPGF